MATFGIAPSYIQEWSDLDYWTPDESQREPGLVGYMHEGPHTDPHIRFIADRCRQAGVAVQFWQVGGSEREVIDQMRRCDVFLGMNLGKHPLYGEGCPRAANEAQHTGCVLICYNVLGNSEYVTDGYTGYLVKRGDPQAMAERLIGVMRHDEERETVRRRGIDFALHAFSSGEGRYQQIKEFLDL
jgi:glycosyltransferase involved in cell wall biosynthesis